LWGFNKAGQLGDGTTTERDTPVAIAPPTPLAQISCGDKHTIAIDGSGNLYTWGENVYGELGDGTRTEQHTPTLITGAPRFLQVSGGPAYSIGVGVDGLIYGWGFNYQGQLGTGDNTDRLTPTAAVGMSGVVQVAAGEFVTLALKSDGTVWSTGFGYYGQNGDGSRSNRNAFAPVPGLTGIVRVANGGYHCHALTADGRVLSWGNNGVGQLGVGDRTERLVPTDTGLRDIVDVSAGSIHSIALKRSGAALAWGGNADGELGDGTTTSNPTPVAVTGLSGGVAAVSAGGQTSMALMSDGSVVTWGGWFEGLLGDGSITSRSFPSAIPGLTGQTSISLGWYHAATISSPRTPTTISARNANVVYGRNIQFRGQLLNRTTGAPVIGVTVQFFVDGVRVVDAVSDSHGNVAALHPEPRFTHVGTHVITIKFFGDVHYEGSSNTAVLTVTKADTSLSSGFVTGQIGQTVTLAARLRRLSDARYPCGRSISFFLDGTLVGVGLTDATGRAAIRYTLPDTTRVGLLPLIVKFNGDYDHNASNVTVNFQCNKSVTRLSINTPAGRLGRTATLRIRLRRVVDGAYLSGRTVTFSIDGAVVGTAVTDAAGWGVYMYPIPTGAALGGHSYSADFAEDAADLAATATSTLTVNPLR